MRRMMVLCLLSMIAMSLGECQFHFATSTATWTTDESGSRYVEGVLVTGDSTLAEIDVLDYGEGRYPFDYTIDEIHVDVLLSTITVDYTIVDEQYPYYLFYSQMRQADGWGECVNYTHRDLEMSSFSHTIVFPYVEGTETYRFLLVKAYKGPNRHVENEDIDKATAGFTIRIPTYDDRKHITANGIRFELDESTQSASPYTQTGRTTARGTFSFFDADVAVTTATLVIYEVGTERLAYSHTFDVRPSREEDGLYRVNRWNVSGLSPHVAYRAELLVSGFDGIDAFVDRYLGLRNFETSEFWGTVDSAHGMYAYQVPMGLDDNGCNFMINVIYDGFTAVTETDDPLPFVLRIRDEGGAIVHEEAIDQLGFTSYSFDNEHLGIGHAVSIESESGEIVLCRDVLPFVTPHVSVYYRDFTEPKSVSISWNQNHGTLIYAWVEITQGDNLLLRYEVSPEVESDSVILTLSGVEFYGPQPMARIVYEYTAFGGHDTVTVDDTKPA